MKTCLCIFIGLSVLITLAASSQTCNITETTFLDEWPFNYAAPASVALACPDSSWTQRGSSCYKVMHVPQNWDDAHITCQNYGGHLPVVLSHDLNLMIGNSIHEAGLEAHAAYWIGMFRDASMDYTNSTEAMWATGDMADVGMARWAAFQPDSSAGACVSADMTSPHMWSFMWCNHELPFVCQMPAIVEGNHLCLSDGTLVNAAYVCDGESDCDDASDELLNHESCTSLCLEYLSGIRGTISSEGYSNSQVCTWVLEGPQGTRMQLQIVGNFSTEINADYVDIWSGGSTITASSHVITLSGHQDLQTFISSNNWMIIQLSADTAILGSGFVATWTTEYTCDMQELEGHIQTSSILSGPTAMSKEDCMQTCLDDMACNAASYGHGECTQHGEIQERMMNDSYTFLAKMCPGTAGESTTSELPNAGGMVEVGSSWFRLYSPFYPTQYFTGLKLSWSLSAPSYHIITIQVIEMDLAEGDFVTIYDGDSTSATQLAHFEGEDIEFWDREFVFSSGHAAFIYMEATSDNPGHGFQLKVIQGCMAELTRTHGMVQTPSYGDAYPVLTTCTWLINPSGGGPVLLDFDDMFAINSITDDRLEIYEGMDDTGALVGIYNETSPGIITALSGQLFLRFTSDAVFQAPGFSATYSISCPEPDIDENSFITDTQGNIIAVENVPRVYGSAFNVSCATGYMFASEAYINVTGDESLVHVTCDLGGVWNVDTFPQCTEKYCGSPYADVEHGFLFNLSSPAFGGTAEFVCSQGHSLTLDGAPTCTENGTWINIPTCDTFPCPAITPPLNGTFVYRNGNESTLAAVVEFICDEGYQLDGIPVIYCQDDRTWSAPTTPQCIPSQCLIIEIENGSHDHGSNITVPFMEPITYSCDGGYELVGNATLTCMQNSTFDDGIPHCMNIDECTVDPTSCEQNCVDTPGSFYCTCHPGYTLNANLTSCDNVDECLNITLNFCDDACSDTTGSYLCSCTYPGVTLFTPDGSAMVANQEMGSDPWNIFRFNQSCVYEPLCDSPPDPFLNGVVLSERDFYYLGHNLTYFCDLGFVINRTGLLSETVTCELDGWSVSGTECVTAICPSLNSSLASLVNPPVMEPSGDVMYGTVVNMTCTVDGMEEPFVRTRQCLYNPETETYELQGDILECGVIDCGVEDGVSIPGSNISLTAGVDTVYGSAFYFGCADGADPAGNSSIGGTLVICQSNGQWDLGSLYCQGPVCPDPGTPAGAQQIVPSQSYVVGSIVELVCDRPGYIPEGDSRLLCESLDNATASWNTTISPCIDVAVPVFVCDSSTEMIFNLYDDLMLAAPSVTDNSGLVAQLLLPAEGPYLGAAVMATSNFTWSAMDALGNMATCQIPVVVDEYQAVSWIERCSPEAGIIYLDDFTDSTSVPSASYVNYTLTEPDWYSAVLQPGSLEVSAATLYTMHVVELTVEDVMPALTSSDTCLVSFTVLPELCREFSLREPLNGVKTCSVDGEARTCEMMCDDGYAFMGYYSDSLVYDCTEGSDWMMDGVSTTYVPDCVAQINATFTQEVILGYTNANSSCNRTELLTSLEESMDEVPLNTYCPAFEAQYPGLTVEYNKVELDFTTGETLDITLHINYYEAAPDILQACATIVYTTLAVQVVTPSLASLELPNCPDDPVYSYTGSGATAFKCLDGVFNILEEYKCMPCQTGSYQSNDTCIPCPYGQYQNETGQEGCHACPSGTNTYVTGAMDISMCYAECPAGWVSLNALPPCSPCAAEEYWVNATTCTSCPPTTSTIGRTGSANMSACMAECSVGSYSATGYEPCLECPRGYYQDTTGQTTCTPCGSGLYTSDMGSNDASLCIADASLVCNRTHCTDQGECQIAASGNHLICQCDVGFTGWFCESPVPDSCDSSPCYNGGTCDFNGTDYSCTCSGDWEITYTVEPDTSVQLLDFDSRIATNISACQDLCNAHPQCMVFTATANTDVSGTYDCYFFDEDDRAQAQVGFTRYVKSQTYIMYFNGTYCENDLVDDCASSPCLNNGQCQDRVGGYTCFCGSAGGIMYTGDRCEESTEVCQIAGQECFNGGSCIEMSTFRRYCECAVGYTGDQCEIEIDECVGDPCLYGGNCTDLVAGYSCTCEEGFTGEQCHILPLDLCDPNPCGGNGQCIRFYPENEARCVCDIGYGETMWTEWYNHNSPSPDDLEQRYLGELDGSYFDLGLPIGIECRVVGSEIPWYQTNETLRIPCVPELGLLCYGGEQEDGACEDYEVRYLMRDEYSFSCEAIDECDGNMCLNGGTCEDGDGEYTCTCVTGYEGSRCQHDVDDCATHPCMNDGICMDGFNSYNCNCVPGFTGLTCDENIDDCVTAACDPEGTFNCTDLVDDYLCTCLPGYDGMDCSINIDECASMPCLNGAECEDQIDAFYCNCTAGWSGELCDDVIATCSEDTCTNATCIDLHLDHFCVCPSNTYSSMCEEVPDVCSVASPCLNGATCMMMEDEAMCLCGPGYTGEGCEYEVDFCSSEDQCLNDGTCEVIPLVGFICHCAEGYSGLDCSENVDDCVDVDCGAEGMCIDGINEAFCMCPFGLTGEGCAKAVDRDYDLEFCGTSSTHLLHPFVMNTTSVSVVSWVKFGEPDGEGMFLCLHEAVSLHSPVGGDPILCMHDEGMTAYLGDEVHHVNVTIPFGFLNDGSWHYIAASWDASTGLFIAYLDNLREERDAYQIGAALPELCTVVLGTDYTGWLSQVQVIGKALTTEELFAFNDGDYEEHYEDILQDFDGYELGGCVQRVLNSTAGYRQEEGETVKSFPEVISCPISTGTYSESRITTLDWTAPIMDGVTHMDHNYLTGSQGGTYTQGVYDIVYVGTDDEGGAAVCAFPGYVRLDECPEPVVPANVTVNCTAVDTFYHTCTASCSEGQAFLRPVPNFFSCGPEGIWDPAEPYSEFTFPQCGTVTTSMIHLEFGWHVYLQTTITTTLQSLQALLEVAFQTWATSDLASGICLDASCSNLEISVSLVEDGGNDVAIDFILDPVNDTVGIYSAPTSQAVLQAALQDGSFLIEIVSYADIMLMDSFYMLEGLSCSVGSQIVHSQCVECTVGTFFNTSSSTCEDCPVGYYQDMPGHTNCTACPVGETTEGMAATDMDHCYTICTPGHFFNETECAPCGRGYYQGLSGQTFCHGCDVGMVTRYENATSCDECIDDCPDGTQLAPDRDDECMNCSIGTYRSHGVQDTCVACPSGLTTPAIGAITIADCSLAVCPDGEYRVGTNPGTCMPCAINSYRYGDMDMTMCMTCGDPSEWTTLTNGTATSDGCIRYCPAGFYLDGMGESAMCHGCPVDYYKPADVEYLHANSCLACPPEMSITLDVNSTSIEDCRFGNCSLGYIVNPAYNMSTPGSVPCLVCPAGTYQPNPNPIEEQCIPCDEGYWTRTDAASAAEQCEMYCDSGYELSSGSCVACERGYYKNNTEDMFGMCVMCPADYITAATGLALGIENCTVANCSAGTYLDEESNVCMPCPNGTYSDTLWQTVCTSCPDEWYTNGTGSDSIEDCINPFLQPSTFIWTLDIPYEEAIYDLESLYALLEEYLRTVLQFDSIVIKTIVPGSIVLTGNILIDTNTTTEEDVQVAMTSYPNTTAVEVANNPAVIECMNGTTLDLNTLTCVPCPAGTYQDAEDVNLCRSCPANYITLNDGAIGNVTCILSCPAGEESYDNVNCMPCDFGFYKDTAGTGNCTACPVGQITLATGSLSAGDCVADCSTGYFHNGSVCELCAVGTYSDTANQASCTPCTPGTTTYSAGSTSASDCLDSCDVHSGYCMNEGTCTYDADMDMIMCLCREPYLGDRCEIRGEPETYTDIIIGAVLGGVIGIIFLVLLIVCICMQLRYSEKPRIVFKEALLNHDEGQGYYPLGVMYPQEPRMLNLPMAPPSVHFETKDFFQVPPSEATYGHVSELPNGHINGMANGHIYGNGMEQLPNPAYTNAAFKPLYWEDE